MKLRARTLGFSDPQHAWTENSSVTGRQVPPSTQTNWGSDLDAFLGLLIRDRVDARWESLET